MPVTRTKTTTSKPYERPAASTSTKAKGKGKADAKESKATVNIGAPSANQSSRKGKKAWRKNVDVTAEETALEAGREEERLTGGKFADRKDGDLFTIDTTGDVEVARKVRQKKPLRSLAVLHERSALPAFTSRVTAPASSKKKGPSGADKSRIRKIARRTADTTSSADVHVTDTAELKDAWRAAAPAVSLPGGFGTEGVYRPAPKAPKTLAKQRALRTAAAVSQSADEIPTTGVSYNPVAEAHAALIADAVEEEKGRLGVEARDAARTAVLGEVVAARRELDILAEEKQGMVRGMRIGQADGVPLDASSDEEEDDAEPGFKTKQTKRKTQAQRNKALRAREAAHALKLEQQRKKIEKAVGGAKTMGKAVEARARAAEEAKRLRKLAAEQRERTGFAGGEKVGRHRVAKEAIGVQLGEDLAESLRQIKPEGNLFKNHFVNLQRRALVEPRVPQMPKKRTIKIKEYEKHAFKRFK